MAGPVHSTPMDGVLVRFGEIGIKSAPVRRAMTDRLRRNLLDALVLHKVEGDVRPIGARLWMVGPDVAGLARAATHTFGVVSVSPARSVEATMPAVCAAAAELAMTQADWTTFAIRATREGKHPFTSQDVGIQAGSAVHQAATRAGRAPKVDLGRPDLEVHVDVRQSRAYVFTQTLQGPGGIPTGTQGRVVALVSDRPSLIAAWMMLRRGCQVFPVHAGTQPPPDVDALQAWGLPKVQLMPVAPKAELLAAATAVARRRKATALVTGDTIRSTLLPATLPVLRPMCGLDQGEADRIAHQIGWP